MEESDTDDTDERGYSRLEMALKYEQLTEGIINAFYHVYNALGYGFLEKVYENALCVELRRRGYGIEAQHPITVWYEGVAVGEYFADFLVNQAVIIELKSAAAIAPAHEAQLINYLKATGTEVGLLLNFGPRPQLKRKVNSPQAHESVASASPRSNE